MRIDDRFNGAERTFRAEPFGITLLREHELEVLVNGVPSAKLVCTAGDLVELALGHLFSEGLIRSAGDVDVLRISPDGFRAEMEGRPVTGGGAEELPPVRVSRDPALPEMQAAAAAERFRMDMPLHVETRSTHCAFLLRGGGIVFETEDISRHSAVDKALGRLLVCDIAPSEAALFISGRIPADVVRKVVRAGVPVLMSKELPTKEAVDLAVRYGLILLSRVGSGETLRFS